MISYLEGRIIAKNQKTLTCCVNGIGYKVHACANLLEKIREGESVELFIYTHVREDILALYGFSSQEQLAFFELLLGVSGVGPKSALEILNAPLSKVKQAIVNKDSVYLTHIPGIGAKTAQRIIVDLHGKVEYDAATSPGEKTESLRSEDVIQALVSLGYHRQQVVQGLKKVPHEITDEETVIKYFLQNI